MIPSTALYNFDFVFCIDTTESMAKYDTIIKELPFAIEKQLTEICNGLYTAVKQVRVKFVAFEDYASEGENAVLDSPFFTLPDDADKLNALLAGLEYVGGGDAPENALEALYKAFCSDWIQVPPSEKRKHAVILLTDAAPLPLQARADVEGYAAENYPADLDELCKIWTDSGDGKRSTMSFKHKKLFMIIPENTANAWSALFRWNNTYADIVGDTLPSAERLANEIVGKLMF